MEKIIKVNKSIFEENKKRAELIKTKLNKDKILSLNVMASPGAGKTSVIMETIKRLREKYRIGVIEGDIVPIDVEKIQKLGVPVVLAHTGGSCHLNAAMVEKALEKLDLKKMDLLIIENVGNLICPASFDLGTHRNIVIASLPEGDDKPYKYPTIFRGADVVLLNKIDYEDREIFDEMNFKNGVKLLNKKTKIIKLSCRTGDGVLKWISWIDKEMGKFA